MELSVEVTTGPAVGMLLAIQDAMQDYRPVWADTVDPDFSKLEEEQFASQGGAGGEPWEPLTPATLAYKSRWGRANMGTLRFSGRLWASLVKSGGPDSVVLMEPMSYERFTTVPYAAAHMTGYSVSKWGNVSFTPRNVPARPPVPRTIPEAYVSRWAGALAAYVVAEGQQGAEGKPSA